MENVKVNKNLVVGVCQICGEKIFVVVEINSEFADKYSRYSDESSVVQASLLNKYCATNFSFPKKELFCGECKTKLKKLLDSQV
jgi:hypothetical protein